MNALMLFAQQNKFGQQPPPGGGDAAGLGMMFVFLCIYGVIILAAIFVQIMFLLSLSRCLKAISPRNRKMEPGQVWLNLIPIFNYVWIIMTILRIADSLKDEYDDRGMSEDGDFGKTLGIIYFATAIACGPVGIIPFIMYWVKIAGYTKALTEGGSGGGGSRRPSRDDDEDDRPRRRRPRDDDEDDDR